MRARSALLVLALALSANAAHAQGGAAPANAGQAAGQAAPASESSVPLANPVANRGVPWPFAGFVVNVPDLAGLYSTHLTAELAAFGRIAVNPLRTWSFTVLTLKPGRPFASGRELAEYMRARRETGFDPKRITKRSHQETAFEHGGRPCTRYAIDAADRGDRVEEAANLFMRGVTCAHPEKPDLLVDLGYAERGAVDALTPALATPGDKFLASLRFMPLAAPEQLRTARERERAGDVAGAAALLKPLAAAGDTGAAALIGTILVHGRGVPADPAEGRKFLEIAAKDGWVDALFNLGAVYDKGLGVPRDPEVAAKWFTLAADQRDPQAQLNLGIYEWNGENARRNPRKACDWWRMAAGNGNTRAGLLFRDNNCKQFEPPPTR
jgi:TPR repeat protein